MALLVGAIVLGAILLTVASFRAGLHAAQAPMALEEEVAARAVTRVLPVEAHDLAYDPNSNKLWLALMRFSGPDELVAVDADSLEQRSWTIPDADYSGFLTRVKVDDHGVVWVSQPYRLVRFDPASESMTQRDFDLETEDALSGALDPANLLPGTWLSGIAFDGDSVLVARNNVPYLTVVSSDSLEVTGRIDLPPRYAGAQDLVGGRDGRLWVITGPTVEGAVAEIGRDGVIAREVKGWGTRLAPTSDGVLALGMSSGGPTYLAPGTESRLGASLGLADSARAAVQQGDSVIYDPATGTLNWFDGSALTRVVKLTAANITIPLQGGFSTQGTMRTRVNALTFDRAGRTWYLDARTPALVRLH